MRDHPDTALMLLDVVMETDDSGLEVARCIREEVRNQLVRIVLRTGQPGQAPEDKVIIGYDINDYKTKTELTTQKFLTAVVMGLRAFRDLTIIEAHRRELQRMVEATDRFVPREFLSFLKKQSIIDVELGDHAEMGMTILFSDIRSFAALSEPMTPAENFEFINSYLKSAGPIIRKNHGFVGKYTGDGLMGLFPSQVDDAVVAAIETLETLSVYNSQREQQGQVPIGIGIGVHAGEVMLGTVGEEKRMQGDAMSDSVNLARRIESLTKMYGTPILISEGAYSRLQDPSRYAIRLVDCVQVQGRSESVTLYEVFDGDPPDIAKLKRQTLDDFERGLCLYRQRQFTEAKHCFNNMLQTNDRDALAGLYVQRCKQYQIDGVPDDWEGITVLVGK